MKRLTTGFGNDSRFAASIVPSQPVTTTTFTSGSSSAASSAAATETGDHSPAGPGPAMTRTSKSSGTCPTSSASRRATSSAAPGRPPSCTTATVKVAAQIVPVQKPTTTICAIRLSIARTDRWDSLRVATTFILLVSRSSLSSSMPEM